MTQKTIQILAAALLLYSTQLSAEGGPRDSTRQTIHTEVVTKGTRASGQRVSSMSGWSTFTAPPGYAIVASETTTTYQSRAGSQNHVEIVYADPREVVSGTGITQPGTIRIRSHARSPSHKVGARGWTKAKVYFRLVKYLINS